MNEGFFDPSSFVNGMKKKAIFLGVDYLEGDVVSATLSQDANAIEIKKLLVNLTSRSAVNKQVNKYDNDNTHFLASVWL